MNKIIIVGASVAAVSFSAFSLNASTNVSEVTINSQPMIESESTLASGSLWTKKSNAVYGAFHFEQRGNDTYLVIDSDFQTKAGPDLKFVLSPLKHDKVKGKNAQERAVTVGLLKSNSGKQEFLLPAKIDLNQYRSLLVHCEQYTKLWAAAPINEGELLAYGDSWTKKSNKITGAWEIAKTTNGLVVRLGQDFKTRSAPDLKLFFSKRKVQSSNGDNATNGSTFVAELQSNRGASEYLLKDLDSLDGFESMLIHCVQYSKLWGGIDF
jgi:hypothetical protein